MSHEIRNPLVAIKTYAQLLPERYDEAEFRTEFSRIVTEEVDRLNRIIEQINDFAHPPDLQFKMIDIPQLLQRGIGKALEHETYTDVPIQTMLDPNLPSIKGDPKALSECFANLITNALEATYDQGAPQIELKAHQDHQHDGSEGIVVTVTDNGPGIPREFQDKIFSPFCTSKPRGMGLGLPIAKRTVIDHNGSINIDSAPEGTHVVISLPAFTDEGDSE
jgi:nitrogen-specific signal transduction histidine kinase